MLPMQKKHSVIFCVFLFFLCFYCVFLCFLCLLRKNTNKHCVFFNLGRVRGAKTCAKALEVWQWPLPDSQTDTIEFANGGHNHFYGLCKTAICLLCVWPGGDEVGRRERDVFFSERGAKSPTQEEILRSSERPGGDEVGPEKMK